MWSSLLFWQVGTRALRHVALLSDLERRSILLLRA
jgi:hypothetical protein